MNEESKIYGVSIRGWITICMVLTVCIMSGFKQAITEPLYTGFSMALGFYLGQKNK